MVYQNNGTGWAPISSFDYSFDIQSLPVIPNPPVIAITLVPTSNDNRTPTPTLTPTPAYNLTNNEKSNEYDPAWQPVPGLTPSP